MIATLTGTVTEVKHLSVVLDVGGVGYLLFVAKSGAFSVGETMTVFTHLAVRENALDLYAFQNSEEREMFEHLIKLPKIGPKTAIQILSQADLVTLKKAAASGDATYLSKMSGIGKKSAEKIVAGLKDVLEESAYGADTGMDMRGDSDVMEALLSLGYSQRDAFEAVKKLSPDVKGTNARIKEALKEVSR